ncbi:MAG: molecular chaperone TorD family protein [Nitrososphaerales archaeon]
MEPQLEPSEFAAINRGRATLYSFLSTIYSKELTAVAISELKNLDINILTTVLEEPDIIKGVELLKQYINNLEGRDLKEVEVELAVEYANLFLGVQQIVPHPSESVYLSEEHLLMQKQRDEVVEMYRQIMVEVLPDFTEPEDHIAVELAFMAYLSEKTATSLEQNKIDEALQYIKYQKRFLDEHLTRWVPMLCRDILNGAKTSFYQGIAMITRGFVAADKDIVNEMLKSI